MPAAGAAEPFLAGITSLAVNPVADIQGSRYFAAGQASNDVTARHIIYAPGRTNGGGGEPPVPPDRDSLLEMRREITAKRRQDLEDDVDAARMFAHPNAPEFLRSDVESITSANSIVFAFACVVGLRDKIATMDRTALDELCSKLDTNHAKARNAMHRVAVLAARVRVSELIEDIIGEGKKDHRRYGDYYDARHIEALLGDRVSYLAMENYALRSKFMAALRGQVFVCQMIQDVSTAKSEAELIKIAKAIENGTAAFTIDQDELREDLGFKDETIEDALSPEYFSWNFYERKSWTYAKRLVVVAAMMKLEKLRTHSSPMDVEFDSALRILLSIADRQAVLDGKTIFGRKFIRADMR
jgi:hypothetical protein